MQSINALALTPEVNHWLANSQQPRILHIFDRACNLINERREVLSLVTPQIGNGPFNLVLENAICFSEYLSLKSQVTVSRKQLHLGVLTIHTSNAKPWSPRPNWERLHASRNHILPQLNQLPIANDHEASPWDKSPVSSLSSALVNADLPTTVALTSQLAGLGQGLTPSGDDFLMGAIYALWIIHAPETASVIANEIAAHAAPLTTSLSAAWLQSAGRGEAGVLWHDLFQALIVGGNIQLPITKLLSIGETSGADALAGFLAVFDSWAGWEASYSLNLFP